MTPPHTIAVLFHRFGPYHQARLKASARRCHVLAIEEAAQSSEYAWDAVPSEEEGFQRVALITRRRLRCRHKRRHGNALFANKRQ